MSLAILNSLNSAMTLQVLRRHLTMGPCCMLAAAVETPEAVHPAKDLAEKLCKMNWPKERQPIRNQLNARAALIEAYHGQGAMPESIENAIRQMVDATHDAWQYKPTAEMLKLNEVLQGNAIALDSSSQPNFAPSFLSTLLAKDQDNVKQQSNYRLVELLQRIAAESTIGWTHPGLLMAGGMLAAMTFKKFSHAEYSIETVVMFAAYHPQYPSGVVARLTMQRLSNGCGLLLPDPRRCGYMLMSKPSIAIGLQNAFHAARGYVMQQGWNRGELDYDWQWSLDLLHARANLSKPLKELPQLPIEGRSMEVAFACAMIAAAKGNPDAAGTSVLLDPHIGATASLDINSQAWKDGDFHRLPLVRVDSIPDKTILGRMESQRLGAVVIADDQPDGSLPIDSRYEFSKQPTLQAAYGAMVRFPRITRAVKQAISRKATRLLAEHCRPYVEPALAWEPKFEDLRLMPESSANQQSKWKHLTDTEFHQLCTGQLRYAVEPRAVATAEDVSDSNEDEFDGKSHQNGQGLVGNRVWVCAESGLGKSMFILFCQKRIAESDGGLVPIRLGRTSDQDFALSSISCWQTLTPETLVKLPEVVEFLEIAYPQGSETQLSDHERLEWYRWLWKNGQLVFLLDALDQTDRDMEDLAHFLGSGAIRRCSTIMTGRPESLTNQAKAFRGNMAWNNLRLCPFDRPRQTQYLGTELAEQLLPRASDINWRSSTSAEELRRHQWKDLLEVPLLLCLLKTLATDKGPEGLEGITSKYDLYSQAVDHLIKQAPIKIEDRSQLSKIKGDERELLEEIAWSMIQSDATSNQLVGNAVQDLRKKFKGERHDTELLDIIVRINIATLNQILERSTSGSHSKVEALAFRHRSFMEFFAGCYFANRLSEQAQEATLVDIHSMLDAQGEIRSELLPNQDRPAIWQETLRFALSAARDPATQNRMARRLIELGNPWVVYQNIQRDNGIFSAELSAVVRRLVHQNWNQKYDYTPALSKSNASAKLNADQDAFRNVELNLDKLVDPSTRDAAYLSPLRDLAGDTWVHVGSSKESSVLEQMRSLRGGPPESPKWNFLESFVQVSGGTFDLGRYHEEFKGRREEIEAFALADFPVTNELFELFCPTHRRWRDQYSREHDQPVLHVNWYMASEFCRWLSALTGQQYRLPTEWEWEWACRWLCDRERSKHADAEYWWDDAMDDSLCWYGGLFGDGPAKVERRTRSRSEAIAAVCKARQQHPSWISPQRPGLLDMLGNTWEWCESFYEDGGSRRVFRGGSWNGTAGSCRSALRSGDSPGYRDRSLGFRVSLVPSSK